MVIEKNHNGAYIISEVIKGFLVTRVFYGYNKREAVKEFKEGTKSI